MKIMLIGTLLLAASAAHAEVFCQSAGVTFSGVPEKGVDYRLTANDYTALINSPSKLDKPGVERLAADADPAQRERFEKLCITRRFISIVRPNRCTLITHPRTPYWSAFLTEDERTCASGAVEKFLVEHFK